MVQRVTAQGNYPYGIVPTLPPKERMGKFIVPQVVIYNRLNRYRYCIDTFNQNRYRT
jgi:hypothetical protein